MQDLLVPGTGDEVMAAVRFGVPPMPADHVPRGHVAAELDRAEDLPLVLVSAPAGTGKTVAVAEWVRSRPGSATCWVDFEDHEVSFWGPVLEALRRKGLAVPTTWSAPPGTGLGGSRLHALASLVVGAPEPLTVVVDGYQMASLEVARTVHSLLRLCLGRLRFVFVGRVDPILPLYRYRLHDSVREVRAPDLAFSDEDAARLLRASGVDLGEAAVRDLNRRLGGWAAGLRFAAKALSGRSDAEAYVATVVEQSTDINAYLVGEVLDAQPPEVRRLLLDTCVTDVFCADLVDLVGGASADRTLGALVDRGAFVEAVPGAPGCYRYFPFFRRHLLAQLSYESPDRLQELRRIASGWYRRQGRHVLSLEQLALVGDTRAMAEQIVDDGLVGRILLEEPGGALSAVARRLPDEDQLPAARVVRAATELREGAAGRGRCAQDLASARRALAGPDAGPGLLMSIAVTDALRACLIDDPVTAAERATEADVLQAGTPAVAPQRPVPERETVVAFAGGIAALRNGDLAVARTRLARAAALAPPGVSGGFRSDCLGHLAVADALQGDLAGAVDNAQGAMAAASRAGLSHLDVPPSAHLALALVAMERCDTDLLEEHVTAALSSRKLPGAPFVQSLVEVAAAALERSRGRTRAATDRLEAAITASTARDPWVADHLRVEAAALSLAEGEPDHALEVLGTAQAPDRAEVQVAAAAAHVEQGVPPGADALVEHVTGPLALRVSTLLVEASHAARVGSRGQARSALAQALRLAAPASLRRPFREAGPTVQALLQDPRIASRHGWLQPSAAHALNGAAVDDGADVPAVIEPLTVRELEVLGRMEELLTTEEIAEKMYVSVNTVRTHIRHILRKLGVDRRNAAIRRARLVGILQS